MKPTITLVLIALALPTAAWSQTRVYDSRGKSLGYETTDSRGNITIMDDRGKVTGRTFTDSQGTTTIYDARGNNVGRFSTPPQKSK